MMRVNGDTDEFLQVIFDFLNKKKFSQQDNVKVKEKVLQALENTLPSNPTRVENSAEIKVEEDVNLMSKEERREYLLKKCNIFDKV